jgi:hypothetical protein
MMKMRVFPFLSSCPGSTRASFSTATAKDRPIKSGDDENAGIPLPLIMPGPDPGILFNGHRKGSPDQVGR